MTFVVETTAPASTVEIASAPRQTVTVEHGGPDSAAIAELAAKINEIEQADAVDHLAIVQGIITF